jgi:hypothetical protein
MQASAFRERPESTEGVEKRYTVTAMSNLVSLSWETLNLSVRRGTALDRI